MNPEVANIIHDDKIEVRLKANGKEIILGVIYDADANFDYFTNTKTTHDGTCIFTEQAILELLNKMLFLKTCYNNASEEFIENPLDYNIKYIIGDILIHNDFGMKNINGNMIYAQTETLVLPIKFEYIKREI